MKRTKTKQEIVFRKTWLFFIFDMLDIADKMATGAALYVKQSGFGKEWGNTPAALVYLVTLWGDTRSGIF